MLAGQERMKRRIELDGRVLPFAARQATAFSVPLTSVAAVYETYESQILEAGQAWMWAEVPGSPTLT
jgi:hypothetical protein